MWASEVQICLHGCSDLVAAEAVYHSKCLMNKELEQATDSASKILGKPEDQMMLHWFKMLLELEAGGESFTLTKLHDKMKEISDNSEVYTVKRLKQKLLLSRIHLFCRS